MSNEEPTLLDKAKDLINSRKQAYVQIFEGDKGEFMKTVMKDLERFCRANESCFHPDQRVHAVIEGRREVWLRIQQHLTLTPDELHRIFLSGNKNITGG